jgi:segregation and condensation protein A
MSPRPPTDEATNDAAVASEDAGERAYRVKLPMFEGPLDLLLHLIQKHELNILDIPIGFVAQKYVEYIRLMEEMSIDLASEYLVMAATLAHLKSRSLLPPDPTQEAEESAEEEEEEDPRAELIRKLLEYQKYKHAAETLGQREVLGRDTFPRGFAPEQTSEEAPLAPMSLFKLVDAFESVLKRAKQVQDHQIDFEKVSITDRIGQIVERLREAKTLRFEQLFDGDVTRAEMIVTFLALLEMTKLRMTRLSQEGPLEPIVVELALSADQAKNFRAENAFEQVMEAVEQDFAHDKPKPVTNDAAAPWDEAFELEQLSDEELAEELREAAQAFALEEGAQIKLTEGDELETRNLTELDEDALPESSLPRDTDEGPDGASPGDQLATFGPPDEDDFFDEDDESPALGSARGETAFRGFLDEDEDDDAFADDDEAFSLDDLRNAARALAGDDWDSDLGSEDVSAESASADDVSAQAGEATESNEPLLGDVPSEPNPQDAGFTWPEVGPEAETADLPPEEEAETAKEVGSEPETRAGESDDEEDSQDRGESDVESR